MHWLVNYKYIYIMKIFFLIFINLLIISATIAKEYVIESQGERVLVKAHHYSDKDNLKIFRLEGTFKDNAGNFGDFNSIVTVNTVNNNIEKLEASNQFIYKDDIIAYNSAKRVNNELEQGVGRWLYTYASKDISTIISSECIYSITYYKNKYLTLAKCNIPNKAFEEIKNISR